MSNLSKKTTTERLTILEEKQRKDLALYSPSNCAKYAHKIKTIKDVLELPSKSLGDFKREYGKDWVIGYISVWLIELNDNSSVKNKMSDAQMEFTAMRIFETYSLKVTDLTLFFRNVKEGVYGQFYETLSSEKIMEWLGKYYDLRCQYGQMQSQCNSSGFSIAKDKVSSEVVSEMFKDVGIEKIEYDAHNSGLGARLKEKSNARITQLIRQSSTDELRDYLIKNDANSELYDNAIFLMVETELDLRNKHGE